MTEHSHAWALRAIANGEPGENFEVQHCVWGETWKPIWVCNAGWVFTPGDWKIRRKPRTIRIGEIDVPEPMREAPAADTEYWIASNFEGVFGRRWHGDSHDQKCLAAGICHLTKEAAELHRKALILVSGGTP